MIKNKRVGLRESAHRETHDGMLSERNVMKTEATVRSDAVEAVQNTVPKWVMPAVTVAAFLSDGILTTVCFLSAFALRSGKPVLSATHWSWSEYFLPYSGILLFAIPARLALLMYQRLYRFGGAFSYVQEVGRVFKAVLIGSLLLVGWAFLFRGGFTFREYSYSRSIFIIDFAFSMVAFTAFHVGLRFVQTRLRQRGINLIPTLVVGTNNEAVQTVKELAQRRYLGYRVIGIVDGKDKDGEGPARDVLELGDGNGCPIIGHVSELASLIRKHKVQELIITDEGVESDALFEAMMQIGREQRVEFRFAPKLFDLLPQKTSVEQLGILPMVRLFREPLTDIERFLKRFSDLVIASVATILGLPIWLITPLLIKFDSPGPVLFKQERVGMDGRLFLCYKFRTMKTGADDALHREMYRRNVAGPNELEPTSENPAIYGKVENDPRITRVGRWLRRTSLDELPQIINVFRGEMSIVGPRPPIAYEVEIYDLWHRKRLDVRPGMTGLWQVSGRNRLTFEEMVKVDLYYIENWSLLLDLKILFLTLPAVFKGDGAG